MGWLDQGRKERHGSHGRSCLCAGARGGHSGDFQTQRFEDAARNADAVPWIWSAAKRKNARLMSCAAAAS